MPQVVLRNPDLPGQPIVLNLAPGEKVAASFRQMGFAIDTATTPLDAVAESEATRAAADRAAKDAPAFVPEFEDDDTTVGGDTAVPNEQGDDTTSLDLTKEQ